MKELQAQQAQQAQQTQKGGEAMKKLTHQAQAQGEAQQAQTQIYFVTFTNKVSSEKARKIIRELRERFPAQAIFTPRPPRGKKVILHIHDEIVIVTFPYTHFNKQESKQEKANEGFTLKELIKDKKT